MTKKVTIFIEHLENKNEDFEVMQAWLVKWKSSVKIQEYSTGGFEHCWNLEVSEEALKEIPKSWLCWSDWADEI